MKKVDHSAYELAEEIILDKLLPSRDENYVQGWEDDKEDSKSKSTRQKIRKELREGKLDDKEIEIDLPEWAYESLDEAISLWENGER